VEPETGKERLASERLADLISELEEELEEVKVKYEMYFIGAERMEPARRRDDLKRNVARLQNAFTRNAGLRFRIQALHARYLSYERLWNRSAREKEAGTYRRDILKVRRKAAEARGQKARGGAPGDTAPEAANEPTAGVAAAPIGQPPVPPAPAARPPPPSVAAAATLDERELRELYDAYVAAKRSCNEDVTKVSFESLARTVQKQAPEIAAKYKAQRVEFKVAVRDGKAVLTAVPKK
jgi:hypothetical protein